MIYYSKYDLNTYRTTPYFMAHLPSGYRLGEALINSRAFRRLPPNLKRLSELSKQWAALHYPILVARVSMWYDDKGYEVHPDTKRRLSDKEVDDLWASPKSNTKVKDIPVPPGGFADPATWTEPVSPEEPEADHGRSEAELLHDIKARSREYVAKEYGVEVADTDKALARRILAKRGKGSDLFAGAP